MESCEILSSHINISLIQKFHLLPCQETVKLVFPALTQFPPECIHDLTQLGRLCEVSLQFLHQILKGGGDIIAEKEIDSSPLSALNSSAQLRFVNPIVHICVVCTK